MPLEGKRRKGSGFYGNTLDNKKYEWKGNEMKQDLQLEKGSNVPGRSQLGLGISDGVKVEFLQHI